MRNGVIVHEGYRPNAARQLMVAAKDHTKTLAADTGIAKRGGGPSYSLPPPLSFSFPSSCPFLPLRSRVPGGAL